MNDELNNLGGLLQTQILALTKDLKQHIDALDARLYRYETQYDKIHNIELDLIDIKRALNKLKK